VRKNKKKGSNTPSLIKLNVIFSIDKTIVCEIFSTNLSYVLSPNKLNIDTSSFSGLPYELPSTCNISLSNVDSSLAKLRFTNSVGPDGLLGTFIYNFRFVFCFPLFLIYSKYLYEGAKLFESFVLKSIHRPVNCIIIDEQQGFRPGRSVTTFNLIFNEY